MQIIDIQQLQSLLVTGSAGAAGGVVLWKLLARFLRNENFSSVIDTTGAKLVGILEAENTRLREENNILQKERNAAASEYGKLTAQVDMFSNMVQRLEEESAKNENTLADQYRMIRYLELENARLKLESGATNEP